MMLEYADRWVTHGVSSADDTCAPSDKAANYGVTYGPDGKGGCIKGSGRFPGRDGTDKDGGYYDSSMVNEMWAAYRNSASSGAPAAPTGLQVK